MSLFTIILYLFLYGIIKSIKDKISFHYNRSVFTKLPSKYQNYTNPDISWRNKWKNGNPDEGERFFGSSTIFVMFTDFWHLLDFMQIVLLVLISYANLDYPILGYGIFNIITYLIVILVTFELFFSYFLEKRK